MWKSIGSPAIEELSWGKVKVEGIDKPFKDVKLYPGGAREWDWRETGTKHSPGIQPADVQELLENGALTIILSRGTLGALKVMPETLSYLEGQGVSSQVLRTPDAVRLYNQLVDDEAVGALIHSTC